MEIILVTNKSLKKDTLWKSLTLTKGMGNSFEIFRWIPFMMFLFYPGGYFVFLHGYRKETGLALLHGDLKLRILFRNWIGELRPILNFIWSVDVGKMCDSFQNTGNYLIK